MQVILFTGKEMAFTQKVLFQAWWVFCLLIRTYQFTTMLFTYSANTSQILHISGLHESLNMTITTLYLSMLAIVIISEAFVIYLPGHLLLLLYVSSVHALLFSFYGTLNYKKLTYCTRMEYFEYIILLISIEICIRRYWQLTRHKRSSQTSKSTC